MRGRISRAPTRAGPEHDHAARGCGAKPLPVRPARQRAQHAREQASAVGAEIEEELEPAAPCRRARRQRGGKQRRPARPRTRSAPPSPWRRGGGAYPSRARCRAGGSAGARPAGGVPPASRSPGRCPPAPCPSRAVARSCRLPAQAVALDLLVEVRARHLQRPRGLRHVPVVLPELLGQEVLLRVLLEPLEGLDAGGVLGAPRRPSPGAAGRCPPR